MEDDGGAILREGCELIDLWEDSPIRLNDNESHTGQIVDVLFPSNPRASLTVLCLPKARGSRAKGEFESPGLHADALFWSAGCRTE